MGGKHPAASIAKEQNAFCKACQQFNITPTSWSAYEKSPRYQLDYFQDVFDRSSKCNLCQLIAEAYLAGPLPYGPVTRATWSKQRVEGNWVQEETSNASCLWISINQVDDERKNNMFIRQLSGDVKEPWQVARRVEGERVDFDMARSWLNDCENGHGCQPSAAAKTQVPPMFKLIDVQNMCIIEPPAGSRYLTLSYMWGTKEMFLMNAANVMELSNTGGLELHWNQIAPTIQDAIIFTASIGEQYLWVDSLCIVQDGGAEKLDAINAMDLVYSQATAMVCAVDDACLEVGLPGITQRRLPKQHVKEVIPGLELVAQYTLSQHIDGSAYASRGWTYQEEQLATRIFYIVNNQVYFTCARKIYAEDTVGSLPITTDQTFVNRVNARKEVDLVDTAASSRYFQAVRSYTVRDLKFQSDKLNAFSGVLSAQSKALKTQTHYGLPTAFFDLALLWQPTEQLTRNAEFPSWSWAGWSGGVRWLGDSTPFASSGLFPSRETELTLVTLWHVEHTWIDWRKFSSSGMGPLIWTPPPELKETAGKYDIGYRAMYSTQDNPYGRKRVSDSNPMVREMTQNLKTSSDITIPLSTLLNFHTFTARFRISPSRWSYLKYGSLDPNWEPRGRIVFLIMNRHSAISGYVLLDESWHNSDPEIEHEFLLLSDANYYCDWRRPHEDHPYKKGWGYDDWLEYHVMMVKEVEGSGGVVERAGIGRVMKEAVQDSYGGGAVWKEVILG